MLTLRVQGLDEARRSVEGFSDRRFAAAVATALTRTAASIRTDLQREAKAVFDRPTPYTLRQLRYVGATAANLTAAVGFDIAAVTDIRGTVQRFAAGSDVPSSKYLQPQVAGGGRRAKRFEVLLRAAGHLPAGYVTVPGQGAAIDAYGNMSRGQLIQILSQLRITAEAGYTRDMSFDARKQLAAQRKAGGRFFVIPVGDRRAAPGVYQREFAGRGITPVIMFVRAARYTPRFDFYGIASRLGAQRFPAELQRALAEHQARLGARAGR